MKTGQHAHSFPSHQGLHLGSPGSRSCVVFCISLMVFFRGASCPARQVCDSPEKRRHKWSETTENSRQRSENPSATPHRWLCADTWSPALWKGSLKALRPSDSWLVNFSVASVVRTRIKSIIWPCHIIETLRVCWIESCRCLLGYWGIKSACCVNSCGCSPGNNNAFETAIVSFPTLLLFWLLSSSRLGEKTAQVLVCF